MRYWGFRPYVSVARRQANAAREMAKLTKKGRKVSPVKIEGHTIAHTFWGRSWCDNLEAYSDFANRLPRGRTYVRNGSVVDLQIEPGRVTAMVSGSELYEIAIKIKPLAKDRWKALSAQCAGQIASVIELLRGKLSKGVMEIITRPQDGMFPKPAEIEMECSCPDWAGMCKHLAAVLYGVGRRLDEQPELLFTLRQVDCMELIQQAGDIGAMTGAAAGGGPGIAEEQLTEIFGVEMDTAPAAKLVTVVETPAAAPVPAKSKKTAAPQISQKPVAKKGRKSALTSTGEAKVRGAKAAKQKRKPPKVVASNIER